MNNKMTTIAQIIFHKIDNQPLTIEQARNAALLSASLHRTDKIEMAEEGMYSHHYIYNDESHLIIDDEGYVYCAEDQEIRIVCVD